MMMEFWPMPKTYLLSMALTTRQNADFGHGLWHWVYHIK
jgi:hypothetical protein